ncbi:MAG: hypothetical protein SFZ03_08865 [Candidatus Melainabacteria bacterium]|nr:hypothetical protein [Candidatus Melainabacteria bacterium]
MALNVTALGVPGWTQPIQAMVTHADFLKAGASNVSQNMFIYGTCVNSRVLGGYFRHSPEEAAEVMRRDYSGWLSWFFITPMVQVGLMWAGSKLGIFKPFQHFIVQPNTLPATLQNPQKPMDHLRRWLWNMNPLERIKIGTFDQIIDRKAQALSVLKEGLHLPEARKAATLQAVERYFQRASHFPSITRGIGFIMTCLVLGVGVPYMNIVWTRKSLAKKMQPHNEQSHPAMSPQAQTGLLNQVGVVPSHQHPLPFPLPQSRMFAAKQFSLPNIPLNNPMLELRNGPPVWSPWLNTAIPPNSMPATPPVAGLVSQGTYYNSGQSNPFGATTMASG